MGKAVIKISDQALLRLITLATTGHNQPPADARILTVVRDASQTYVGIESESLPKNEQGAGWPILTEINE